jgi:hypothetical protein
VDEQWRLGPRLSPLGLRQMPVLYKLYIVHPLTDDDDFKNDPYRKFVADLVPAPERANDKLGMSPTVESAPGMQQQNGMNTSSPGVPISA